MFAWVEFGDRNMHAEDAEVTQKTQKREQKKRKKEKKKKFNQRWRVYN
jgi:hypothetical protein